MTLIVKTEFMAQYVLFQMSQYKSHALKKNERIAEFNMQVFKSLSHEGEFGKCKPDKMQQLPSTPVLRTGLCQAPGLLAGSALCNSVNLHTWRISPRGLDFSSYLAWKDLFYETWSVLQEWLCFKASPTYQQPDWAGEGEPPAPPFGTINLMKFTEHLFSSDESNSKESDIKYAWVWMCIARHMLCTVCFTLDSMVWCK